MKLTRDSEGRIISLHISGDEAVGIGIIILLLAIIWRL